MCKYQIEPEILPLLVILVFQRVLSTPRITANYFLVIALRAVTIWIIENLTPVMIIYQKNVHG